MTNSQVRKFLQIAGLIFIVSGVLWTVTYIAQYRTEHWIWFSRFALGALLIGISGLIKDE